MSEALQVIGAVSMVATVIFAALAWWNARVAAARIKATHEVVTEVKEKLD